MCYNAGSLAKEVINSATMMRYLVNATQKILTSAASTRSKQSTSNSATPADASGPTSMRSLRKSKRNLKLDKENGPAAPKKSRRAPAKVASKLAASKLAALQTSIAAAQESLHALEDGLPAIVAQAVAKALPNNSDEKAQLQDAPSHQPVGPFYGQPSCLPQAGTQYTQNYYPPTQNYYPPPPQYYYPPPPPYYPPPNNHLAVQNQATLSVQSAALSLVDALVHERQQPHAQPDFTGTPPSFYPFLPNPSFNPPRR